MLGSMSFVVNAHLDGARDEKVSPVMATAYHVHEYGCLAPVSGEALAVEEMRRRTALWNSLVEIKREYRRRSQDLLANTRTGPADQKHLC